MISEVNLPIILAAALLATASPGPATLLIASTAMSGGRRSALITAAGVTTGSWFWALTAALGLAAIMLANAWVFEAIRYLGAVYLFYLGFKSARSALSKSSDLAQARVGSESLRACYLRGLALHLTNPKAILFFGALFSIGIPQGTSLLSIGIVIASVGLQSLLIFHGYALLFSHSGVVDKYKRLRRWFEGAFAVIFGIAALKMLTSKMD